MDELGEASRYWGHYGESHGRHMAELGTIYRGCWGTHGGTGDNVVGVLGDMWRYWRAAWWEYRETPGGTGCPCDPWNNSEGVLGHPLAPPTN